MKRSISVTLVGILAVLGSLLTLALAALVAFVMAISRTSNPAMKLPGAQAGVIFALTLLVLPSLWGVATGIGIFFLKGWARISIIVFGAFIILAGFFGGLMILTMPLPTTDSSNAGSFAAVRVGIAVFYFLMGAIGLWWVLLFNTRSVKAQFAGGQLMVEGAGRPVSISIISWLLILGTAFISVNLLMRLPVPFLGLMLTGWSAAVVLVVLGAFQIYTGIGLLRLKPRARVLALYYCVFGFGNGILIYALPGSEARMAKMTNAMSATFHQPTPTVIPFPHWPIEIMVLAMMFVQVYFLVTRKPASHSPPSAGPTI